MEDKTLERAKDLIPFDVKNEIKQGGVHSLIEYSWKKDSWWTGGWEKEGELLLNSNGSPTGEVVHINYPGIGGTWRWQEYYSGGEARYLLKYYIKSDSGKTEEEVTIYEIG